MTPSEIAETLIRGISIVGDGDLYRDATKNRFVKVISKVITEAVEKERRACAEIARSINVRDQHGCVIAMRIAQAIEARGEKKP